MRFRIPTSGARTTAALTTALLLSGCFDLFDNDVERPPAPQTPTSPTPTPSPDARPVPDPTIFPPSDATPPPHPDSACLPADVRTNAVALFRVIDDAVHELITCGRAQVGLAQSLGLRVLISNPDAIDLDDDTRDLFEMVLAIFDGGAGDMVFGEDGAFHMGGEDARGGVAFTLRFRAPDGALVTLNPLHLDNYFEGVTVHAALTHDAMSEDGDRPNHYLFTYDTPGPLAGLLAGVDELKGAFALSFSLNDIVNLLLGGEGNDIDFGPFEGLADATLDSDVTFWREVNGATVNYTAAGRQARIADLADSQSVDFDMVEMSGERGNVIITPIDEQLTFVERGRLAGTITWAIDADGTRFGTIVSDFGSGAAYPTNHWSCEK